MKKTVIYALASLIGCAAMPAGASAQADCKFYKVTAPVLNVSKEAEKAEEFVGILETGEMACVSREQTVSGRKLGYVDYKMADDGQLIPLNGWVGLRYMLPQGTSPGGTATANAPAATPAPVKMAKAAPPADAALQEASEKAYKATAKIGTCGAYKLFEELYRSTFYGRLAQQHITSNCKDGDAGTKVAAASPAPAPAGPAAAPATTPGTTQLASGPDITPAADAASLTVSIQQELARLGCNPGSADGDWGLRTRQAMSRFNQFSSLVLNIEQPDQATLATLRQTPGIVCTATATATAPVAPTVTKRAAAPVNKNSAAAPAKKGKRVDRDESFRAQCMRKFTQECLQ